MDSDSESKLISLITQLISIEDFTDSDLDSDSDSEPGLKFISLIIQITSLVSAMDLDSHTKPLSKFMSVVNQTISFFNSMDLDYQPKPLSELIPFISQLVVHSDFNELRSLMSQSLELEPEPELISLIRQTIFLAISMSSKWGKLISLSPQVEVIFEEEKFHLDEEVEETSYNKWDCLPVNWKKFNLTGEGDTHFLCEGCTGKNHKEHEEAPIEIKHHLHPKHSLQLVLLMVDRITRDCCCCDEYLEGVFYYCSGCDYSMNIACVEKPHLLTMDSKQPESKLISLITQIISLEDTLDPDSEPKPEFISLITQTISWVSSMDLDWQPKPESKLMSLVTQTITLFNSMDFNSMPKPLLELISLITQLVDSKGLDLKFKSLMLQTLELKPEPKLLSIIHQIFFHIGSMNLISLSPHVYKHVDKDGKFHVQEKVQQRSYNKWHCLSKNWDKFRLTTGVEHTHFLCRSCYGKNHEEYEKAPIEIKHPLHPKHSLQLALFEGGRRTTYCYCCDEDLKEVFYYCSACDFAMKIACLKKPPVLYIDHPKWHEHTLAHFPRHAPITCDLCALPNSKSSAIYMCPPCDFVVHQSCLKLPRVIRISRHFHRISFTFSFDKENLFCGVCRKKIDNDYGGYSCIKDGCSYAAHSKCATQRNVLDGIELEGEPEEIEEEVVEPFVTISDGIIRHFSHDHHHLRDLIRIRTETTTTKRSVTHALRQFISVTSTLVWNVSTFYTKHAQIFLAKFIIQYIRIYSL